MNKYLSILSSPFKYDKVLWGAFVAILALHVYAMNYSIMTSIVVFALALGISVLIAHVPARYYKAVAPVLYTLTMLFMLCSVFMSDSQLNVWMKVGNVTFNPRSFAGLTTVLTTSVILTNKHISAVRRYIYALLAVSFYLNILAIMDIGRTFSIMFAITMALYICNVARKKLTYIMIVAGVTSVLLFGGILLFGKTSYERNSENIMERSVFLKRVDNWKERIIEVQPQKQSSTLAIEERSFDAMSASSSVVILTCVLLLTVIVVFRTKFKLRNQKTKFVILTGIGCACILFTDTVCCVCLPYLRNTSEYSLVITSCLFGMVISCIGSPNKCVNHSSVNNRKNSLKNTIIQLLED